MCARELQGELIVGVPFSQYLRNALTEILKIWCKRPLVLEVELIGFCWSKVAVPSSPFHSREQDQNVTASGDGFLRI